MDYTSQIVYCIVYGGSSGGYIGLTSVALIDVVGIVETNRNRFGQNQERIQKVEMFGR